MRRYIVFGSWKIRHDEPLNDLEKTLYIAELRDNLDNYKTILVDIRQYSNDIFTLEGYKKIESSYFDKSNLNKELIPLAVIESDDLSISISVTHLIMRIEHFTSQFFHFKNLPIISNKIDLLGGLVSIYQENYIYSNNFECYYEKGIPDTELEQKFSIENYYNFYYYNELFYTRLANGEIKDFAPHLGDEIEHWSYDNNFYEITDNAENVSGYVSVMYWSRKRKLDHRDFAVTYKKKMFSEDSLERWERNYHNQYIESTPKAELENYFQLPIKELPDWRRVRLDIACEYLPTGDIYMLNFEDSRIKDISTLSGRLQQCEIEYLKTRGECDEDNIYIGFNRLSEEVERFIQSVGLIYTKNHYSKLTFLKDFMEMGGENND